MLTRCLPLVAAAVASATILSEVLPAQESAPHSGPATSRPSSASKVKEVVIPNDQEEGATPIELTLQDALRIGRRSNTNLAASELLPLQSKEDLRAARAFFEPELYGDIGAGKSETPTQNVFSPQITRETYQGTLGWRQRVATGGLVDLAFSPTKIHQSSSVAGFPSEQHSSELRLTVTQPLLRGAWSDYGLRRVRGGEIAAAGSEQTFQQSVQDTLLDITRAYWELVFARENYKVVFLSLDLAREQLRITKERIRVRELADRDRVADEADVSRREEELITAENVIRTREDQLRRLLYDNRDGLLWRRGLRPTSPIHEDPPVLEIDWRACAEVAMRHRPDLMARRSGVSLAEIDLMAAERDILPRLDLVGSYSDASSRAAWSSAWSDTWGLVYPDWSVLLQFSLPIGNNQALSARDRAKLVVEQRKRELYSAEMDAESEVREAVRALKTLALRTKASRESVRLAETNLDTERQKLRVGLSTAFEVQRRNQELMEARSRLLRNQLDHEIATAVLLHSQGLFAPAAPASGEKRL